MTLKRILVPVDFSKPSLKALDYAVELGKPFGAELAVVFVVEPIYYAVPDFAGTGTAALGGLLEEQRRAGKEQLLRLERQYAKHRVKLRALLQTGTAHQAICDTAGQVKADLIVMATHGRTGLSHVLLGSVAERVVRTATCPVLTVHAGKRRTASGPRQRKAVVRRRSKRSSAG